MDYKLVASRNTIDILRRNYKISRFMFNFYIKLSNVSEDVVNLQKLLNKPVVLTDTKLMVLD